MHICAKIIFVLTSLYVKTVLHVAARKTCAARLHMTSSKAEKHEIFNTDVRQIDALVE